MTNIDYMVVALCVSIVVGACIYLNVLRKDCEDAEKRSLVNSQTCLDTLLVMRRELMNRSFEYPTRESFDALLYYLELEVQHGTRIVKKPQGVRVRKESV